MSIKLIKHGILLATLGCALGQATAGELTADEISTESVRVETNADAQLSIREDTLGQIRAGDAFVIASDESADNGVIHIVDQIISYEG